MGWSNDRSAIEKRMARRFGAPAMPNGLWVAFVEGDRALPLVPTFDVELGWVHYHQAARHRGFKKGVCVVPAGKRFKAYASGPGGRVFLGSFGTRDLATAAILRFRRAIALPHTGSAQSPDGSSPAKP